MTNKTDNNPEKGPLARLHDIAARKNIPLEVQFEVTYRCNLACQHCYVVPAGTNELSFEEICTIIDELLENGTIALTFTGGEVFVRKDFLDILRYARSKGFVLDVLTNGTLIDPSVANKLKDLKVAKVEISLYGATSCTHDTVTQVAGSFDATIRAVNLLTELGVPVCLKTVLMSLNAHECTEIKSLANKLNADLKVIPFVTPTKNGDKSPQRLNIDHNQFSLYAKEFPEIIKLDCGAVQDPADRLLCKAGMGFCSITPEGKINPCVMMPIQVGDLRADTFGRIWFSHDNEPLQRFRSIEKRELDCAGCSNIQYCDRCAGLAYLETGNFLGSAPSACRVAEWRKQELVDCA